MARPSWRMLAWLDARLNRLHGWRLNPLYQSGSIAIAMLVVMTVTGLYLVFFYRLSAPWESIVRLQSQGMTGRWIRAAHRYSADIAVVAVAVHVLRMYAQRRSWGPRAVAWMSGVILLGLLFVCGWTGYVMVWDTQGRLIAREGARLLDLLPLFSEPVGRAFAGEQPMPSAFFFLNLFAHVALPIGFLVLLWVHVSRLARPALFPPRRLLLAVLALLLLAAVMVPAPLGPEGYAFRMPGRVPLDLFYVFWIPLAELVPAWVTLTFFVAGTLLLLIVPLLTRPGRDGVPKPSHVDERLCTGCEQCWLDCPYDAISMVARSDGRTALVARVDESLCVSCGICAGSCAPMGVGPPGRTGRDQLVDVRAFLAERKPGPEDVVLVGCAQSGLAAAGEDVPVFSVGCAGNLHTSTIEYIVRSGAGGVLIAACPGRDCWNREGAKWLEQRVFADREAELKPRVDRARIRFLHAGRAESSLVREAVEVLRGDLRRMANNQPDLDVNLDLECEREGASA